jgi:hypothetical protein
LVRRFPATRQIVGDPGRDLPLIGMRFIPLESVEQGRSGRRASVRQAVPGLARLCLAGFYWTFRQE